MLSERKQEIVKLIHNNKLDIEVIAENLGVSSRTIRRDLINIIETLDDMGYTVTKEKTVYMVNDENLTLFKELNESTTNNLNTEEKILVVLSAVAVGKSEVNIEQIANDLYVTPSSIKTLITKFLEDYSIINRTSGLNLELELSNDKRRDFIIAMIRNYMLTTDINSIILKAAIDIPEVRNYHVLESYIDINLFNKLLIEVEDIFNESNKYITDFQLIMIVMSICISSKQQYNNKLNDVETNIVSNQIIENLIAISEITTSSEIIYLKDKLDNIITEFEYEKVDLTLISEISSAIGEVENKLGIEFNDKKKLEYQICTHNARTINEANDVHLSDNISLSNFIKENIYLYEIIKSVDRLRADDESNLQYLLIYFVMALEETLSSKKWQMYVICFGGMGTSLMIKKQLEKEYPNSIIENISYARALASITDNADLVVSNYKLPNNLQNLVVGHVVTKENIKEINSILLSQSSRAHSIRPQEKIMYNVGYKTNESNCDIATHHILDYYQSSSLLNDSDYVYQKLKKREAIGVGIPDSKIAFFHTRSSSINSLIIATYDVDPFATRGFDGLEMECSKVLLVLVPVDISEGLLEKVNILSYSLISDPDLLQAIINDDLRKIKQVINK